MWYVDRWNDGNCYVFDIFWLGLKLTNLGMANNPIIFPMFTKILKRLLEWIDKLLCIGLFVKWE